MFDLVWMTTYSSPLPGYIHILSLIFIVVFPPKNYAIQEFIPYKSFVQGAVFPAHLEAASSGHTQPGCRPHWSFPIVAYSQQLFARHPSAEIIGSKATWFLYLLGGADRHWWTYKRCLCCQKSHCRSFRVSHWALKLVHS